jgi:3-deoxy-manno-octulosonate cytidylyltransferase (CMP-KDO synthetase)
MKIIGIVPARMSASRFPGKPLHPILGRPMIEHVFERAMLYKKWSELMLATCDKEIADFGRKKGYPVVMTSNTHIRALDRVAEAVKKSDLNITDDDIVVNVQGDEPMLTPEMIETVIEPFIENSDISGTMLTMDIVDEDQYYDPDILKVVHDLNRRVLYTSRSPIPYTKKFTPELGAKRIYGIFAFRWGFLKEFTALPESPLEIKESCDSNRLYDNSLSQHIAPFHYIPSFSVDSPKDINLVEKYMKKDLLWGTY